MRCGCNQSHNLHAVDDGDERAKHVNRWLARFSSFVASSPRRLAGFHWRLNSVPQQEVKKMVKLTKVCSLVQSEEFERVWHVAWSLDGLHLVSCGEDKVVKIWAVQGEDGCKTALISTLEDAQSRTVRCSEWSPNGQFIASASFDGTVVVWESQNSSRRVWDQVAQIEGHESEVKAVSWSLNGNYLATCGRDKKVWIWEKLGDCEFECVSVLDSHTQDVKFVAFHPSKLLLLSASYDDTIRLWGEENDDWYCVESLRNHSSTVWCASFNHPGDKIVSCSDDKSMCLWESDNSSKYGSYRMIGRTVDLHEFPIYSCHWSPENGLIATGAGDNAVSICSVGNGTDSDILSLELMIPDAHDGDVNCVRWNPVASHSNLLASCGDDGRVNIWKLEI
jgi:WD40 repeat protein